MKFWLILGFIGQIIFGMRFLIQWICSEKRGRSYIPVVFWYFSVFGGVMLLAYAIHIKDPVFIMGQALGIIVYIRNLVLIQSKRALKRRIQARKFARKVNFEYEAVEK